MFGGFSRYDWRSENKWEDDTEACLFSVDLKETYPVMDIFKAIYWHSGYGPWFGENNIRIVNNPNTSNC